MTYIDPAGKLLWHLDQLDALRNGHRLPPVNVEVDLSNRCSLGCTWCHFAYTHTKGPAKGKQDKPEGAIPSGDLMDPALAYRVIGQLRNYGVKSISWTGGGEPTLHPDFDDIVGNAWCWAIDQGIYTHGGHIDEIRARLMKRFMTWIYISLDAADGERYSQLKGVPAKRFNDVIKGVKLLVDADGDATIGIGFILNKDNYLDAGRMVDLARGLGADYCQFRPAVIFKAQEQGESDEHTGWAIAAFKYLERWKYSGFVKPELARFDMYHGWAGHGYKSCWWSGMQTVITPIGKVWTCVNKREFPGHCLGDLNEQSFADIWKGSKLAGVNGSCRILCRGHVANKALEELMIEPAHVNFI